MFATDLIFKQQENLVDNQKCQAGFRTLCKKDFIRCRQLIATPCYILTVPATNLLLDQILEKCKFVHYTAARAMRYKK